MCPDKNLLSAYFDNELGSRFVKDIDKHVAHCGECRQYLEDMAALRSTLHVEDPMQRPVDTEGTWRQLQNRIAYASPVPVWQRRFQIPVPVLAAITLLVIGLSVGLLFSVSSNKEYRPFDSVSRIQLEGSDLTSVEAILSYLDARGESKSSTFNLPQDTKLQFFSEPTLIRAADYQRGRD